MKTLRRLFATLFLTFTLALSAFAGEMSTIRSGEIPTPRTGEIQTTKSGDMETDKAGDIPNLLTGQIDTMRTVPEVWVLDLWLGVLSLI